MIDKIIKLMEHEDEEIAEVIQHMDDMITTLVIENDKLKNEVRHLENLNKIFEKEVKEYKNVTEEMQNTIRKLLELSDEQSLLLKESNPITRFKKEKTPYLN